MHQLLRIQLILLAICLIAGTAGATIIENRDNAAVDTWALTQAVETIPGGATYEQAREYYISAAGAWSQAWGASDIGLIRQYLNQAKSAYTNCLNTASQTNDPANAANLALVKSVSTAYMALADAALAMYDGADVYGSGRTQMAGSNYAAAAASFQAAGDKFGSSQTLFGQATTTLQSVSYAGTEYNGGAAYTAVIVPILNTKAAYMGEFAAYARGWQHTALAYQASTNGDQATFRSEATQAMNLFSGLRTSTAFGADATANYNVLAGLIAYVPTPAPATTVSTPAQTVKQEPISIGEKNAAAKALSYLSYSSFSRDGLIKQLEYEGFTHQEAVYGVDQSGANWNEQAAKKAKSYLSYSSFSRSGLIDQLEYEGFTPQQAEYGVDQSGADWNEQAAKKAKSYLSYSSFSRSGLIDQLEYEGFTRQQAEYGVQAVGY